MREKHRRIYRKGTRYEEQVYAFLRRKGFTVLGDRVRFSGGEVDGITSKNGRKYAIEAKNTKQKVGVNVIKKLKKKIAKSAGTMKGRIIISRSGFTEEALKEETKDILLFKYEPKRTKSEYKYYL